MDVFDITEAELRVQELAKIYIQHPNYTGVYEAMRKALGRFLAARKAGRTVEAFGVVVLGRSGLGKTAAVDHALDALGLSRTEIGDAERPVASVRIEGPATLRGLVVDIHSAYSEAAPRRRESAKDIWGRVLHLMRELGTFVLVLDEIQHVRSASDTEKIGIADILKSRLQDRTWPIVLILIGTPDFADVLANDRQLSRRLLKVHMADLTPSNDLKRTIRTLDRYAADAGLEMAPCVTTPDFAHRLLHAADYGLGELCGLCLAAIECLFEAGDEEIAIGHFEEAFRQANDCPSESNPFIAVDFEAINVRKLIADRSFT